jgi:polysaccharide deacetylase 2 family uncharacterized protein YibQ
MIASAPITISGATHNFVVKINSVLMRLFICCFALWLLPAFAQSAPAKVAIIIDDIGYQKADPHLIKLPYALTFAVMPFTPNGAEMAILAEQRSKEVMLHMPMEAVALNHLLGKGALRQSMSKAQVDHALTQAFNQVPQAVGVNNHMGSRYTSLAEPMDWTMQWMASRGLYFIDSKTTARSQVEKYSKQHHVKSRSRDVFLDNDKSYKAIDKQFNHLIAIAKQHGSAIAIGHPYPETYQYLRKNLPRLQREGVQLVSASQLLDLPGAPHNTANSQPTTAKTRVHAANKTVAVPAKSLPAKSTAAKTAVDHIPAEPVPVVQVADPVVQVLSAETEVQPLELLPWRVPLQVDLPGFTAPSPAQMLSVSMVELLPTEQPLIVPTASMPAIGVLQY